MIFNQEEMHAAVEAMKEGFAARLSDLEADNERLTRERDHLRKRLEMVTVQVPNMADYEDAVKDAARYRWLREKCVRVSHVLIADPNDVRACDVRPHLSLEFDARGAALDAAIDVAMQETAE